MKITSKQADNNSLKRQVSDDLRNKINIMRFICILGIVVWHSSNYSLAETTSYNALLQKFFSQGITHPTIPLLFVISGYLFFLNVNPSLKGFSGKLKTRVKTLLVPYLFCSSSVYLIYLLKDLILHPETGLDFSLPEVFVDIIVYPTRNPQLWFLRDLFICVILTPLIYLFLNNRFGLFFIFLLAVLIFLEQDLIILSSTIKHPIHYSALLYFSIGSLTAIKNFKPTVTNHMKVAVISLWILGNFLKIFSVVYVDTFQYYMLINGIGVFSIWYGYDFIDKYLCTKRMIKLSSYSFFVYVFHIPVLVIFSSLFFAQLGKTNLSSFVDYILAPSITILLAIVIGRYLRAEFPRLYMIITGNR